MVQNTKESKHSPLRSTANQETSPEQESPATNDFLSSRFCVQLIKDRPSVCAFFSNTSQLTSSESWTITNAVVPSETDENAHEKNACQGFFNEHEIPPSCLTLLPCRFFFFLSQGVACIATPSAVRHTPVSIEHGHPETIKSCLVTLLQWGNIFLQMMQEQGEHLWLWNLTLSWTLPFVVPACTKDLFSGLAACRAVAWLFLDIFREPQRIEFNDESLLLPARPCWL